jgi:hypothetical protein
MSLFHAFTGGPSKGQGKRTGVKLIKAAAAFEAGTSSREKKEA